MDLLEHMESNFNKIFHEEKKDRDFIEGQLKVYLDNQEFVLPAKLVHELLRAEESEYPVLIKFHLKCSTGLAFKIADKLVG